MKQRQFNVSIPIPDWIPHRSTLKTLYNTIIYSMFPDRCTCCGKRVDFKFVEYTYSTVEKRIMISYDRLICSECLSNKLEIYFDSVEKSIRECDMCGCEKETIQGTNNLYPLSETYELQTELDLGRVCMGGMWWNGHDFCIDCIKDALKYGNMKSSCSAYFNKKYYPVNHKGAMPHLLKNLLTRKKN